ncbi:nuclease-related domain-containing protein [Bacillus sp. REN16]|uniref:nuclease-related domain-containing protein n=1 Tax=Bacillus sp. REN16 TaxID=2887296 RepID=UPI001E5B0F6B|nr:nuclease-related domain-containing protein [Bacillus sp. REN16]MCC3355823.1 NERD domain-containing protein [Bacillus sp. REN16]
MTKERKLPKQIEQIKALRIRLSKSHPKYDLVEEDFRKRMSGYKGERSLDYYLKFLPEKKYRILKGLRLLDNSTNTHFEIDNLLISKSLILDLDAKNHKGEIYFDYQFSQMHQTYDNIKNTYACPLTQLHRHQLQIKRLLQFYKIPTIPIESLVVFTNLSTTLTSSLNHPHAHKIIHSASLLSKIEQFEKIYRKETLESKHIQKLTKLLLRLNTPFDGNILDRFGIKVCELLKGVHCPICEALPMARTPRKWKCLKCGYSSFDAYHDSVSHYFLLTGNQITNQKLRDFLLLPSRHSARNILNSWNLTHEGKTKGSVYSYREE